MLAEIFKLSKRVPVHAHSLGFIEYLYFNEHLYKCISHKIAESRSAQDKYYWTLLCWIKWGFSLSLCILCLCRLISLLWVQPIWVTSCFIYWLDPSPRNDDPTTTLLLEVNHFEGQTPADSEYFTWFLFILFLFPYYWLY